MNSLKLPDTNGSPATYMLCGTPIAVRCPSKAFNRVVFSAAHVVANPYADIDVSSESAIDWDRTMAYRRYLAGLGLGIAEAMDTAQRGMGLSWAQSLSLIQKTKEELRDFNVPVYSGCGTDHLKSGEATDLAAVEAAYLAQLHAIQRIGGKVILMSSRALAQAARSPDDYLNIYRRVLNECDHKVVLHWLGDMFDPSLAGYWGHTSIDAAMEVALQVIYDSPEKVEGIKISLLDKQREIDMRRRLPQGVKMYTGDDFNYPELIAGDEQGFSHALLGIFDAIAPAASVALEQLAGGNRQGFLDTLEPTVALSRRIFGAPTRFYKTGVVFMAYLNGHQDHMVMLGGHQAMRPLPYFVDIFKMADQTGLLRDPDLACARMKSWLAVYGA
jgi:hypothetical protein